MLDQVSIRACHACSISRNSVDFCHARSSARLVLDQCAGFGGSIRLPVIDMIQKLVVTVLIPIAVGKAIASSSDAAKAGIKRASIPPTYTIFSVCNSFRRTKLSDRISKGCATLQSQYQQARISKRWYQHARISEDMTKSVVFVASSKTLPLALAILSILPPGLGDKGLIALPCILGHFSQES